MAKTKPCKPDRHVFTDYVDWSGCVTACCGGASIKHCRKCGWYISECACGFNNGLSKISAKQKKRLWIKNLFAKIMSGKPIHFNQNTMKVVSARDPCPKEPHRHSID